MLSLTFLYPLCGGPYGTAEHLVLAGLIPSGMRGEGVSQPGASSSIWFCGFMPRWRLPPTVWRCPGPSPPGANQWCKLTPAPPWLHRCHLQPLSDCVANTQVSGGRGGGEEGWTPWPPLMWDPGCRDVHSPLLLTLPTVLSYSLFRKLTPRESPLLKWLRFE